MSQPNVVLLITDDQDIELGSMAFMPKTLRLLQQRGTQFRNAFVSTPICCPSRSSIFTGLYAHNHNVMTNNANCAGEEWRSVHENGTFAVHLNRVGYVTGFFGKYLNDYDGSWVPLGWTKWAALVRNSRYYNYSLNRNGRVEWHGQHYESDYLTDLVTNLSMQFIDESVRMNGFGQQPFLAVLSFPAPHGPEDPAPQFANLFNGVETHRTESWNYAPNPDKQWLLRRTGKMEPVHVAFTDQTHRRRLQTLQSVDDAVDRVVQRLRFLNQLHKTYILYTSDHGYHLGQFGLIKGKSMPYEFDIRVPFFIRGPGIPRGKIIHSIVSNIDIAPTILDIAGINAKMDGRSMLQLDEFNCSNSVNSRAWRQTVLIERGKMPKLKRIRDRLKQQRERMNSETRLQRHCGKAKNRKPCAESESRWQCVRDEALAAKWHIIRCPSLALCECRGRRRAKRGNANFDGEEEIKPKEGTDEEKMKHKERVDNEGIKHEEEADEEKMKHKEGADNEGIKHKEGTDEEKMKHEEGVDEEGEDESDWKNWHQDDGAEHFLRELDMREIVESGQWYQGVFDAEESRGNDEWSPRFKNNGKTLVKRQSNNNWNLSNKSTECQCQSRRQSVPKKPSKWANACHFAQMNCFVHSADHWRTPPFWPAEFGRFCFCQNANNNSYWCLRTVNGTHNFLYCEFVTEEVVFYNLDKDPHQFVNAISVQPDHVLEQLNAQLQLLKSCETSEQCEHYASVNWATKRWH